MGAGKTRYHYWASAATLDPVAALDGSTLRGDFQMEISLPKKHCIHSRAPGAKVMINDRWSI